MTRNGNNLKRTNLTSDEMATGAHDAPPIDEIRPDRTVRHIPLKPHQLTERITPRQDVFVLGHVGIPRAHAENWWLDIAGLVDRPRRWSYAELRALPKRTVTALHECAGFPARPDIATRRYANVIWGGVDLSFLLRDAGVQQDACFLWSFGIDKGAFEDVTSRVYLKDMPLNRLADGDILLAYEMNGEPLDSEHGYPLRLVIPGYYGTNLVKWLYRIELSDRRPNGPYTTKYYNDPVSPSADNPMGGTKPLWVLPPESVIVSPAPQDVLRRTDTLIWGWAWAGSGLSHIDVSTDGGHQWAPAELETEAGWAWRRFTFPWKPSQAGSYSLASRAFDIQGVAQPSDNARNAIHRVPVSVE